MKIIEQKITTILRPTSINLAPYVINPYQGCQLGCLFCYAQFSKKAQKEPFKWGEYVKVKVNALEVLNRELGSIRPEKVLLGSTTECFQPVEKKYGITQSIIEKLNSYEIPYVILSRSLLIGEYIPLLLKGSCEEVYFTIDTLPLKIQDEFEPRSPRSAGSIRMVNQLIESGVKTVVYFCPIIPWISNFEETLKDLKGAGRIEFEIMNFKMAKVSEILAFIKKEYPQYNDDFDHLLRDKDFYYKVMGDIENRIRQLFKGDVKIHIPEFDDFFKNKY